MTLLLAELPQRLEVYTVITELLFHIQIDFRLQKYKNPRNCYTSRRDFYRLLKDNHQHLLPHPLRNGHGR